MKHDIYGTMNELQYGVDALKKAEKHLIETHKNLTEFADDYRGEADELESGILAYKRMRYATEIILKAIELRTEAINPLTPEPTQEPRHSPAE